MEIVLLDEALTRLAESYPQEARVVELRFFGGLSIREAAQVLGVSDSTVERDWRFARLAARRAARALTWRPSGRAATVKRLFDAALEHRPDSLAPFLEASCGGDASLREEVEGLVASHRADTDFLAGPALGVSARDIAERALSAGDEPDEVGRRVGPYRLMREIGRGGVGSVYLAERVDGKSEQRVAVKLVKHGMATVHVLRHFRKEHQILANLDHPNIARLLDGGTTDDGIPYLVMEYVEGRPVDDYADARGLDTSARLSLFLQVCEAVRYAHRSGVIHRDIKPSNILVNEEGVPKLLDFGIAKLLDAEAHGPATQTTTASFRMMTPDYASPEQVFGEPVTKASDVYSLGVFLYELLTGYLPHRFSGMRQDELVRAIESEPEKPSRAVRRAAGTEHARGAQPVGATAESAREGADGEQEILSRELRGDLDNIVLMALRKEPGRRYSSVEQLSEDLRRHLRGQPVVARGDALTYRIVKFIGRNRTYFIPALALAVVCLLLGVLLTVVTQRGRARASVAVLPFFNSKSDTVFTR